MDFWVPVSLTFPSQALIAMGTVDAGLKLNIIAFVRGGQFPLHDQLVLSIPENNFGLYELAGRPMFTLMLETLGVYFDGFIGTADPLP